MAGSTHSSDSVRSSGDTGTPSSLQGRSGTDVRPAERGSTSVADVVVSKIAGIATREVSGVYAIGGGASRMVGALRERIPGASTNVSQGVAVEVGETESAIDIDLVAEYGVAIHELAEGVRRNVISAVEGMTGLRVTEVNVSVYDVHIPSDDNGENDRADEQPRVK